MPFRIQRVPRGLNDLLAIFGGATPQELEDRVRGSIELLQFYGLQQRVLQQVTDPALAENGQVYASAVSTSWQLLFSACATITQTATMTAGSVSVLVQRGLNDTATMPMAAKELTVFGATVTGSVHCPLVLPYPLLLPPGSRISAGLGILGTDATAAVQIRAEIGFIGT